MIIKRGTLVGKNDIMSKIIYDRDGAPDRDFKEDDIIRDEQGSIFRFIGFGMFHGGDTNPFEVAIYESMSEEVETIHTVAKQTFLKRSSNEVQPYHFVKVLLTKKSSKNTIISASVTKENDVQLLYDVRSFLAGCRYGNDERIQYWTQPIVKESSSSVLRKDRPLAKQAFLGPLQGMANIQSASSVKTILNPVLGDRVIQFRTDTAVATIVHGDVIHFVDDNRMVVENHISGDYEFFEIVPVTKCSTKQGDERNE